VQVIGQKNKYANRNGMPRHDLRKCFAMQCDIAFVAKDKATIVRHDRKKRMLPIFPVISYIALYRMLPIHHRCNAVGFRCALPDLRNWFLRHPIAKCPQRSSILSLSV
jgi:hypothetical protein